MFVVSKILRLCVTALATGMVVSMPSLATECYLDVAIIDRGSNSPMLLCGAGIKPDAGIGGFAAAGIEVSYQQYLRRCSPDNRNPGWHLVLAAGIEATNARLTVTAPGVDEPVCEVRLDVSDQVIEPPPQPDFLAAMADSDARFIDINGVRTRYFDKGDGPVLLLVHGKLSGNRAGSYRAGIHG